MSTVYLEEWTSANTTHCWSIYLYQSIWLVLHIYIHIHLFQAATAHRTDKTVQKQIQDRTEKETTATQTDQRETVQYDCGI